MTWLTRGTRAIYDNAWISLREDAVTGPNGDGIYAVVEMRHPAVFIVAVDQEDRVCLVSLERYTVGHSWEVPAGGSDGEEPLVAARRELREEAGIEAATWTHLGDMHALNGIAVAPEHVFLARDLRPVTLPATAQEEEGIDEVRWIPFPEVVAMIADGRITDGETVAALAFAAIRLGRLR